MYVVREGLGSYGCGIHGVNLVIVEHFPEFGVKCQYQEARCGIKGGSYTVLIIIREPSSMRDQ